VNVTSLGYQTDFALLEYGGSSIEDRGDHWVIRSPHNPTFWWGNFLFLPAPPPPSEATAWLDTFRREFPEAEHVALGFDGVDGSVDDLKGFADLGLKPEAATVMTASSVHPPARPNESAVYRPLTSDADWEQNVALRMACIDEGHDPVGYEEFARAQGKTRRKLVAEGRGQWFGAFVDDQLVSQMGLFATREGLARFQSVETHPDFRGQGLAGTLVYEVSRYGFDELGAHTLVMVADPEYVAIRVYRSVGFDDTETQLQVERPVTSGAGDGAAD
jgi:RimJ/RimL family protein N-acetyltransferase